MGRGAVTASIKSWLSDLAAVIFPKVCEVCGQSLTHGEDTLCLECLTDMPRTGIADDAFTEMHKRLASPGLPVAKAASWFYYYRDSPFAMLVQRAKYNGRPKLARTLGRMFAYEIASGGFAAQFLPAVDQCAWSLLGDERLFTRQPPHTARR